MITYIERSDVDRAMELACGAVNNEIAVFAEKSTDNTYAQGLVAGLQSAKHKMLLTFVQEHLMTGDVFKQLFDRRAEDIVKELNR